MDTGKELSQPIRPKQNLKIAASIALILLMLNVARQLISVFQTRYMLISPVIPESAIWQINKQFIFQALISVISGIAGLIFYFYEKYLWILILVGLTLLIGRFVYI
jgi:hypothetical protein